MNDIVQQALECAAMGYRIFPCHGIRPDGGCTCADANCRSQGKHPIHPGWQQSASNEHERVRAVLEYHRGCNYGIATGAGSGIFAVDIDPDKGGFASFDPFEPVSTRRHQTGGGGQHHLFRHPGHPVGNKTNVRPGIDIRGDGGYIIGPGSIHVSGGQYAVLPGPIEPATASQAILDLTSGNTASPRLQKGTTAVIPSGTRNDTLFRIGCGARGRGGEELEVRMAVMQANGVCEPPLDPDEVERIIASAMSYPPGAPNWTEDGLAQRFACHHAANFRFDGKTWWHWNGCRWEPDRTGAVDREIKSLVRSLENEARHMPEMEKALKLARSMQTEKRIRAIKALSATEPEVLLSEDFDEDDYLLNIANGTLRFGKTVEHLPYSRTDYCTKMAPVRYDQNAGCPQFLSFIDEIMGGDREKVGYLQRFFGYSLTGATGEQVFLLAQGQGANGKGTLLEVMQRLLGDYAVACPPSVIIERNTSSELSNDVAFLKGARLAVASETERNQRFAVQMIKRLTGEDTMTARRLYNDYKQFKPKLKLVLATNELPVFGGDDPAFVRRVHLLPFNVVVPAEKRDRHLREKLVAELPGILNWLIEGYLAWKNGGLQPPASVLEASRLYARDMDRTLQFLEEECIRDVTAKEPARAVYGAYQSWCYGNGSRPLSQEYLARDLEKKGINKVKSNNMYYCGIKLKRPQAGL